MANPYAEVQLLYSKTFAQAQADVPGSATALLAFWDSLGVIFYPHLGFWTGVL